MSSVSTTMKTAPVMPRISQYASSIRWPFGDTGVTGAMPPFPAAAAPASARAPANGIARRSGRRRTDGWHSKSVSGSEARVRLPADVSGAFEVVLNGVPQVEGRDYRRDGVELVF